MRPEIGRRGLIGRGAFQHSSAICGLGGLASKRTRKRACRICGMLPAVSHSLWPTRLARQEMTTVRGSPPKCSSASLPTTQNQNTPSKRIVLSAGLCGSLPAVCWRCARLRGGHDATLPAAALHSPRLLRKPFGLHHALSQPWRFLSPSIRLG